MNEMELVVGDVHDNLAVYDQAVAEFMNGRVREGVRILVGLRDYILQGRDPASERVLLPVINAKWREYQIRGNSAQTVRNNKSPLRSVVAERL